MFLLGGRRYPLRVEFFKYKEPTASIRLEWKPPQNSTPGNTTPSTRPGWW